MEAPAQTPRVCSPPIVLNSARGRPIVLSTAETPRGTEILKRMHMLRQQSEQPLMSPRITVEVQRPNSVRDQIEEFEKRSPRVPQDSPTRLMLKRRNSNSSGTSPNEPLSRLPSQERRSPPGSAPVSRFSSQEKNSSPPKPLLHPIVKKISQEVDSEYRAKNKSLLEQNKKDSDPDLPHSRPLPRRASPFSVITGQDSTRPPLQRENSPFSLISGQAIAEKTAKAAALAAKPPPPIPTSVMPEEIKRPLLAHAGKPIVPQKNGSLITDAQKTMPLNPFDFLPRSKSSMAVLTEKRIVESLFYANLKGQLDKYDSVTTEFFRRMPYALFKNDRDEFVWVPANGTVQKIDKNAKIAFKFILKTLKSFVKQAYLTYKNPPPEAIESPVQTLNHTIPHVTDVLDKLLENPLIRSFAKQKFHNKIADLYLDCPFKIAYIDAKHLKETIEPFSHYLNLLIEFIGDRQCLAIDQIKKNQKFIRRSQKLRYMKKYLDIIGHPAMKSHASDEEITFHYNKVFAKQENGKPIHVPILTEFNICYDLKTEVLDLVLKAKKEYIAEYKESKKYVPSELEYKNLYTERMRKVYKAFPPTKRKLKEAIEYICKRTFQLIDTTTTTKIPQDLIDRFYAQIGKRNDGTEGYMQCKLLTGTLNEIVKLLPKKEVYS